MTQLPCTKCNGFGWYWAGFQGLAMYVFLVDKDGENRKLACDNCGGTGQVKGIQ